MLLTPPVAADRLIAPDCQMQSFGRVTALSLASHVAAASVTLILAFRAYLPLERLPAFAEPAAVAVVFRATEIPVARPVAPVIPAAAPITSPTASPAPVNLHPPSVAPQSRRRAPRAVPAKLAVPPETSPAAPAAPKAAPPAPASPHPAEPDGAVLLRFANGLQQVVRAASVMPRAAILQHRAGRAQVRFAYLDGQVRDVFVQQSSLSRVLDDAALTAVRSAHYPPPPQQLRGRLLPLLVWIDFRLQT